MKARLYPTMPTYIDRLVPALLDLVAAVHDEGPEEVRRQVMRARRIGAPRGVDGVEAVVVALAAMVDPSRAPSELLGWADRLAPELPRPVGVPPVRRPHRVVFRPELVAAVITRVEPFEGLRRREAAGVVAAWHGQGVPVGEIVKRTGWLVERVERVLGGVVESDAA